MPDRHSTRRDKVRRFVVKSKLDAFLITNPINVRYLSGFTGNDAFLVVKRAGDVILSDPRFTLQIEEECPGLEAYVRPPGEGMPKALALVLGRKTSGRLGIEAESLTLAERIRLTQTIPSWEPVPTQNIVEDLRQIKDKSEIEAIRKAIDAAARGFQDIRRNLSPEQSEIDIRNDLEYRIRLHGAEEKSFPSIIAFGPRAALPHAIPGPNRLAGNALFLADWGAVVGGYRSDLTRVLILAPKNKKLRKIYDIVLKAQLAAIKAVKPGKTGEEIDAVARAIIKDAGFGRCFNHGLGHALGLEIHESPRFAIGHKTLIKSGMVLTVEPGVYLKDWGGIRIEDDVLVTRDGCEVLSRHVPKSFDEMVV